MNRILTTRGGSLTRPDDLLAWGRQECQSPRPLLRGVQATGFSGRTLSRGVAVRQAGPVAVVKARAAGGVLGEHSGVGLTCLSVTMTLQPVVDPSAAMK